MKKIDYEYETTEERVRAYLRVPEIDRLRWLEELCVFTSLVRRAPTTYTPPRPTPVPAANEKN
jgi:hypothetical protein